MNEQKDNFGVPPVDNTPVGLVGMEGNFLRGLSNENITRTKGLRISIIIFATIFFLFPSIGILGLIASAYTSGEMNTGSILSSLLVLFLAILLLLGWFKVIRANSK